MVKAAATDSVDRARGTVTEHVGFLLNRAHRRFRAATVEALAGSGMNPGQIAVLGALSSVEGLSQTELTDVTGIEKSSMVLLLDGLEQGRWLRRRPHPHDRRAHALTLTAGGRRRLRAIGTRLRAADEALLAPFTPAERRQLIALLQRFADGDRV
jgi:DNA-binding MarR family transcriptional regulator